MKILTVNATIDPIHGGGTAERTVQLSRALVKNGIACTILCLDIGLTQTVKQYLNGIDIFALPCICKRFYIPKPPLKELNQLIKSVDVIHIMGHLTLLNAIVYLLARYNKKPYIVCPAGALVIYGRSRLLKRIYNFVIGKRLLKNATQCIAITQDELSYFNQYRVSSEKINIIPNAVVPENYRVLDHTTFYQNYALPIMPYILFLGRLNSIKGPDLLLAAYVEIAENFPQHHLVFAGSDDGMLTQLTSIVEEKKLTHRVHFIGCAIGEQKAKALQGAEVLVIPSRSEAMSIVVFEAGCTATPVIITDQCGLNDLAKIDAAYVVPATVEGIKQGLFTVLTQPSKFMGENLQHYTLQNFTWDKMVKKYLQLFEKINSENSATDISF